jgi:3-hydroxyacyl-[acyl-carrier-protein] dehydratase
VTVPLAPVGRFVVSPGHPSLPGHFPGQPMVPGVLLLDETIALILDHLPGTPVAGIVASKFVAVVLPGQVVEVACGAVAGDRLDFFCSVAGAPVARGTLRLVPALETP